MSKRDGVVVECKSVSRKYLSGAGEQVAVRDVSFSVQRNARIAISGPSGSGKSTLLGLLAGWDVPSAGSVTWSGELTAPLPSGFVGFVFQNSALIPTLNVIENIELQIVLAGQTRDQASEKATDAMNIVGIIDLATKLPEELSGGQAQRVGVARAIALRPKLLLADEPTGQLDFVSAMAVIDELLGAAEASDAALVVSTHDERVANRLAERWVMTDGVLEKSANA